MELIKCSAFALILIVFLIPVISSDCSEDQIDINSASASKLQEFNGIGPVKSQKIIDARPFSNIDDLINVKGIGPVTLDNIKSGGIACVSTNFENSTTEKKTQNDEETKNNNIKENKSLEKYPEKQESKKTNIILEEINIDPKDIKTSKDKNNLEPTDYAFHGLGIFCVLLAFLLIFKYKKTRRYKQNEFNEQNKCCTNN
jgi:competence ComEA-like helix-hairpin-helix protein